MGIENGGLKLTLTVLAPSSPALSPSSKFFELHCFTLFLFLVPDLLHMEVLGL